MVLLLAVINSLCLKRVNPRHNVKITKLNACLVSTEHHLFVFPYEGSAGLSLCGRQSHQTNLRKPFHV